jgi:hypothetical protein
MTTPDLAFNLRQLAAMERRNGIECNARTLEDAARRLELLAKLAKPTIDAMRAYGLLADLEPATVATLSR